MRRRLMRVLGAAVIAASMLPGVAGPVAAATCKAYDVRFVYAQNYDPYGITANETVTIHARGCYDGTKSWGTSIETQVTFKWALAGGWARQPDPSWESSHDMYGNLNGSTWWSAHPVYFGNGGIDFLLAPTVMLTKTGTWQAYDHGLKACDHNGVSIFSLPVSNGALPSSYGPQLGPDDLVGGGTPTSCSKLSWPIPTLKSVIWAPYT